MGHARRQISACCLGVILAAFVAGCGSDDSTGNRVVARVGSTPITKTDVEHWAALHLSGARTTPSATGDLRSALSLLIAAYQLIGEASAMGIHVSNAEARNRLAEYEYDQRRGIRFEPASKEARWISLLGRAGETGADRALLVRLDVLEGKVEQARVAASERDIAQSQIRIYYDEHKRRFVAPERRDLEVLGNYKKAVVLKAKREIEAGADFVGVAKRVSIDPEAPGGLQLHLAPGDEEPEYDRVVFAARPGVLVGPVLQAFYFIFKVIKVTPAHQLGLAQVEGVIRKRIAASQRQPILAAARQRAAQAWRLRTECQAPYVVSQCREYRAH